MSRIGKQPIKVPSGVTVDIGRDNIVVNGPKGSLSQFMMPVLKVSQVEDNIIIERKNEDQKTVAKHGLMRSLVNNLVDGVTVGFSKKLEINGVGYRVNLQGQTLKLSVGLSHDIIYTIPEGINISIEQNIITVSGNSKQQVGQVTAEIRTIKKPEPYKGKGIKYVGEHVIHKSGKSAKEK